MRIKKKNRKGILTFIFSRVLVSLCHLIKNVKIQTSMLARNVFMLSITALDCCWDVILDYELLHARATSAQLETVIVRIVSFVRPYLVSASLPCLTIESCSFRIGKAWREQYQHKHDGVWSSVAISESSPVNTSPAGYCSKYTPQNDSKSDSFCD
jgi:hypothetical protein